MAIKQGSRQTRRRVLSRTPKVDSEEEKTALCGRFKEAVQKIGGPATFMRGYKIASSTLHHWLSGQGLPEIGALIYLSNQHGFSPDWLLRGNGPTMTADAIATHDRRRSMGSEAVEVPFYEELRPAAGGGSVILQETARVVLFDESWLRRFYGVGGHEVIMLAATGESMEELIHAGEPLLVHVGDNGKRLGEGIFVIRLEGSLLVKRLQPLPGNRIKISSENPAYQPYELGSDDEAVDFAIIGRVLCVCRRL